MPDVLDLLMGLDKAKLPEKKVKIKRLSKECGEPVVFSLRALPYNRVAEIKEASSEVMAIDILLAGATAPNLRDKALLEKHHAPTPAELVKSLLLPGEIEDLSREVERLSGYRTATLEEIKKN